MENKAKISVRKVNRSFVNPQGETIQALRDINLEVEDAYAPDGRDIGEFRVLLGPSGCGKSTILRIIAGLDQPDSGEVLVNGKPVTGPGRDRGMVFQKYTSFPWLTVAGNIEYGMKINGVPEAERRKTVDRLVDAVGLSGFANSYPETLSGGMQQRVAIVRALIHDPAMLLMDEPFGALDAMTRERMNVELMRIQRETGKTVLLITHSIPEAVFLADRVLVMTERPGAIAAIYDVPLPRPRSLDAMADPVFTELVQRIRKHFFTQSALD